MLFLNSRPFFSLPPSIRLTFHHRALSTTPSLHAKNRVFTSVRHVSELDTLLLLSASSNRPLITLWTASWCRSCAVVSPLLKELVEEEGVGEAQGGVGYAEVEMDAVSLGDGAGGGEVGVGGRYAITSIPTLLAFSRQEPQMETRVARLEDLKSREFLRSWIETEARRGGQGGAGGSLFGKLFGG